MTTSILNTPATILARLKIIVVEELAVDPSQVQLSSQYAVDLGADSLDLVELHMQVEKAFGMEIPDAEAEKQKTLQDTVTYIQSHQS